MIIRSETPQARVGISLRTSASAAFAGLALAGSSLALPAPAFAAEKERAQEAAAPEPAIFWDDAQLSPDAQRVSQWVATSSDNNSLPYIIIDKRAASLFLFDGKGELVGHTPILIGVAAGDDATPGVGGKKLAEIGPAERTTPAGRFVAKYGLAVGRQRVLWVDYATSVALHAVITGNRRERRLERLLSPDVEDNRITFGCINVPTTFYEKSLSPLFRTKDGGIVYVLPDSKPIEEVFPRLRVLPFLNSGVL